MQDLKRSRKRFVGKPNTQNHEVEEILIDNLERGSKKHENGEGCGCTDHHEEHYTEHHHEDHKHCDDHKHHEDHKHHHHECEACQLADDIVIQNNCEQGCCGPIMPQKFCLSNSVPYAIEVNRIYDTFKFQTFTDASADGGDELFFRYQVLDVDGDIPTTGSVNVNIETITMNYTGIEIVPGNVTLENRIVTPLDNGILDNEPNETLCPGFEDAIDDDFGQTVFEYNVSGNLNSECCPGGEKISYKEKGLKVRVYGLEIELEGKCGCTEVSVLAYPAKKSGRNCGYHEVDYVEFNYNTLTAPCCLPVTGVQTVLRQQFQTGLRVECIGKALLKLSAVDCHGYEYDFCIPNGIDLVCCLEEVVSVLVNEQIVVLGSAAPVAPRLVDTFSKVCDFDPCGK
ncbi:MAG: hypothetical protein R3Y64_01245 [Peptostreptococcaceae bacterium]